MNIDERKLQEGVQEALRSCLKNVPSLEIGKVESEPEGEDQRPDLLVSLKISGKELKLIIETRKSGQPRLAREAANQLLRYKERYSGAYGVFAAPFISTKAAEICSKEELGYVDLSGNCRLCFDWIYIERQGEPESFCPETRPTHSLFTKGAEGLARASLKPEEALEN